MNPVIPILALSTASFVMVTLPTFLRNVLPQPRIRYRDGLYYLAVRSPGEWYDVREFIQPSNPDVLAIYSQIGPDAWSCLQFVCRNISYRRDFGEFWQMPSETLARGQGDCEDSSILLCSLLRNFTDAHVALGNYQGYGHAWCEHNGQVMETTFTSARPVPDPEDYCPYVLFSDQKVIELFPNALADVFTLGRNEAAKLDLMAATLGA